MDNFDDIELQFHMLDEPRATPTDVRDRIWTMVTGAEAEQAAETFVALENDVAEVETLELLTGEASPSVRTSQWMMVAAAVAMLFVALVAVVVLALPDNAPVASGEFPTRASATACASLQKATLGFDLLALDGESLPTIAQLESINSAFADWLVVLERRDLPDAELDRWREASQRFLQAQLDQSAEQPIRGEAIFARGRDSVFSAVSNSDDGVVVACFGDWADDPFVGDVERIDPESGAN